MHFSLPFDTLTTTTHVCLPGWLLLLCLRPLGTNVPAPIVLPACTPASPSPPLLPVGCSCACAPRSACCLLTLQDGQPS